VRSNVRSHGKSPATKSISPAEIQVEKLSERIVIGSETGRIPIEFGSAPEFFSDRRIAIL
jgi:hypothetical protein